MSDANEPCCQSCKFWVIGGQGIAGPEKVQSADCRCHAPTLVMVQVPQLFRSWTHEGKENASTETEVAEEMTRRVWPKTYAHDWCGSWQQKEERNSRESAKRPIDMLCCRLKGLPRRALLALLDPAR